MNKRQLEVQKAQVSDEAKTIRELKQVYSQARKDCETKIRELSSRTDMENLQSIVYQKQYQEALKSQLDGIIDTLNSNQFTTISDYLGVSYENGFFGTLYDLQGQGIPLIFPINQEEVVQALQVDSKLSQGLYKRLGEDTTFLKKSIRAELSRGVSNGSSWNEIAGHITNGMNSPFNKAYNNALRIARTEGHRVQQEATYHCQQKAKERGADVVKQWDSTLDGATRPDHVELDGQVREIDEPFEVSGHSAPYPGGFGVASEDIHCRCCLLQRARWALSDEEYVTKFNGDTNELVKIQSKTYNEFKQKTETALKKAETDDTIELKKKISDANSEIADLKEQFSDITDGYSYDEWFKDFKSIEDGYGGSVPDEDAANAIKLKDISKKIKELEKKQTQLKSQLPVLGGQGTPMTITEALKGANPNYVRGSQYAVNCQRCVQTYELRRRGYDVEALPKPKSKAKNTIIWGNECFVDSDGNTPSFLHNQSEQAIKTILENAPDGSRHIIYTAWKNSRSAHVFIAEKENNAVKFVDPQVNKDNVEDYFSRSKANKFGILRVDDKDITTDTDKLKATVRW